VAAVCLCKSGIERGCLTSILLSNVAHSRQELLNYVGGRICGTVVNHNDLQLRRRQVLVDDANQGLLNISVVVVSVDYGRNERFHGCPLGLPLPNGPLAERSSGEAKKFAQDSDVSWIGPSKRPDARLNRYTE